MNVPSPRRPLLLLAAAVGVQLLLLAFQIRREHNVRLIRVWTVEAFTPFESAGTASVGWVGSLWNGYIDLRHTHTENRRLQAQVDQLRLQVDRLQGQAAEAGRLAALLGFHQSHPKLPLLAARVISASPAPGTKLIYIDRGSRQGVRANMGVITPDGVVGKVLEVYPGSAQVLLVTDRQSGVGALLAPTRTEGVVKGTGDSDLAMDYVVKTEKVKPGEVVLTSGLDQIFPKDLPVGTVVAAREGSPFERIDVQPAAHLDRLEDVLVILMRPKPPPPQPPDPPRRKHRH
jgi:rod shape-determining protein MreC